MKNNQLLFLALCLFTASCDSKKPAAVATVDTHQVVTPLVKDTSYSREYVAEIQSVKYVEVRSKVKGYIEKIYVDEGQAVKEGQLLFALSFLDYEKELQKANAAHKNALGDLKAAEVELKNVQHEVDKNIISNAELDDASAKA